MRNNKEQNPKCKKRRLGADEGFQPGNNLLWAGGKGQEQ
jgi:hypothetical protein